MFLKKGSRHMKKEDFVKLGVDEETAKKLEDASQEELKGFIPKSRFDEVNEAKKKLDEDIKARDKQLEELKKSSGDSEALKKQIEELQQQNKTASDEYKATINQMKLDNAVNSALTSAKAKNTKAVRPFLNLDKATVGEDGTVAGLEDQIKALKKADDTKFLFEEEASEITKLTGMKPGESGTTKPEGITPEQFAKMGYKARLEFKMNNPEAYESLTGHSQN